MKRSEPLVKVDIRAEPATEIFLLDHQFRLRERGVGRITASVKPGLYKIKYRAGTQVIERHAEIAEGTGTVHFDAPSVPIVSSAPLANARSSHEYHEAAASRLSRTVHRKLRKGSEIFVFARTWTETDGGNRRRVPPVPRNHHPATGLSLRDADGSRLVDIEAEAEVELKNDPWAGFNVAVAPGAYRLRVETPRWGPLEQTVIATEGWQTQVFLLQDDYSDGKEPAFRPDLAGAAILLGRIGKGFDPARGELRLAELARQSLATGRLVLSATELERLFTAKGSSPMLGIYGAHALLVRGERRNVSAPARALSTILGDHPDVSALKLALSSRPSPGLSFAMPPMLSSSWSVIVDKAAKNPNLVPAGSLSSRVAPCLWGSGSWLIWLANDIDKTASAQPSESLLDAIAKLQRLGTTITASPDFLANQLNDLEAALLSAVIPADRGQRKYRQTAVASSAPSGLDAGPTFDAGPSFDAGPILGATAPSGGIAAEAASDVVFEARVQPDAGQLGTALGLPPSSLHVAADELNRKLSSF